MEIMHTDVRVKRVKMSLSPNHLSACKFDIVRRNCSLIIHGMDRFNSNKAIY